MDIAQLIKQPELLDRETLYDLRSLLALYPYYQTARLLLLQNLYLLHDPTFDEELRRAAIYITDRKVIFNLVEAAHYQMRHSVAKPQEYKQKPTSNRTISLIDTFLESIPEEKEEEEKKPKRKPTPADAAVDYVSYLLEVENEEDSKADKKDAPQLKGQDLIDNFINNESGKIKLKADVEFKPEDEQTGSNEGKNGEESYFTETLAKIYIKPRRYGKPHQIIPRINMKYPKKNAYFADQIRFLEKLILNNKNNK